MSAAGNIAVCRLFERNAAVKLQTAASVRSLLKMSHVSCAYPSPRANGKIVTLEGLPMIAEELGEFIAGHGAEQ